MAQFSEDWPEVELISGNGYIGNFWFPELQQPLDNNQYATILGALAAPTSRGSVTITSTDTNVPPKIQPNWLSMEADQEVAIALFRRMREIWATKELKEIVIPQQDDSSEYWPDMFTETDQEILDVIRDSMQTVW